jgi:hypothetical protein
MQCAFCGATLKPGSKVCDACGAEVAPANPPNASVSEEPIPEAFPYADPSAQPVETPVEASASISEPPAYTPATFADIAVAAEKAASINPNPTPVLAIVSLVLGVISLCASFFALCGAPISIIGIILGILSLRKPSPQRGLAIGGIVLNSIGLLLAILFTILIGAMGFISSSSGN